jgi:hypothetical protein
MKKMKEFAYFFAVKFFRACEKPVAKKEKIEKTVFEV